MVSVLEFEPRSGQTKDNKSDISYYSTKHVALRNNGNECLDRNHDNVSKWGDVCSANLVQSEHHHFIECNYFSPR